MNGISPISSEECYSEELDKDLPYSPLWEKVGKVVLLISACSAFSAFIPALVRKRRTYSIAMAPQGASIPNPTLIEEQVTDLPVSPQEKNPAAPTSLVRIATPNSPLPASLDREPSIFKAPRATTEEREKIEKIFEILATEGLFHTTWNSLYLLQLKKEIINVHPFEFLRCAPKKHLHSIFKEGYQLKINGVIDGVKLGMTNFERNLTKYIAGFAEDLGTTEKAIKPLIQAADWEGLVRHLIGVTSEH